MVGRGVCSHRGRSTEVTRIFVLTAILGFRGEIGPQSPTKLAPPKMLETGARAHPCEPRHDPRNQRRRRSPHFSVTHDVRTAKCGVWQLVGGGRAGVVWPLHGAGRALASEVRSELGGEPGHVSTSGHVLLS